MCLITQPGEIVAIQPETVNLSPKVLVSKVLRAYLKTLWDLAAALLPAACVGSPVTARFGDIPVSPPWPPPKSLAGRPHRVFRQALSYIMLSVTHCFRSAFYTTMILPPNRSAAPAA